MSFCRRCIEAVVRLRGKCQFELSHASEPIARPRVIPHGGVQRRFFASSLLWPLSSIQQRRCFSAGAGLAEGDTAYQSVVTIAKLSEDAAKDVSEELLELGVCSSLERDEDCKKGDELFQWQDQKSLWSSSRLVSFFESGDDEEIMQTLERVYVNVGRRLDRSSVVIEDFSQTEYDNWQQTAEDAFNPVEIGDDIFVLPLRDEDQGDRAGREGLCIFIRPGFAFGTGEHETTKLCLRWVKRECTLRQSTMRNIIDYGTGSGILAIGALLSGAVQVLATDVDADAIRVTESNAAANGIDPGKLKAVVVDHNQVVQSKLSVGFKADCLLANILLEPLLDLEPSFSDFVRPGGKIALSGVLADQLEQVQRKYQKHFHKFEVLSEGDWILLAAERR